MFEFPSQCLPRASALANEAAVAENGPHQSPELVPSLRGAAVLIGRTSACPGHRQLAVSHGQQPRLQADLTWGIGVASDVEELPGRAFQARGRHAPAVRCPREKRWWTAQIPPVVP